VVPAGTERSNQTPKMGRQHPAESQGDQGTWPVCRTRAAHREDVLLIKRVTLRQTWASDNKSHNGCEEDNGEEDRMDLHLSFSRSLQCHCNAIFFASVIYSYWK